AVGETVVVEEDKMDAVTALSGSGPGYVFRFMECMVAAGAAVGLEQETARRLVLQTFLGAAHLAKESPDSLSRLRENVTSPGGTTAAGLSVFEEMGLEARRWPPRAGEARNWAGGTEAFHGTLTSRACARLRYKRFKGVKAP
ncbi:MAG: hypothetical protein JRH05_15635, partial [Deltaproteobacteria bacterium]|nr:hypothetical protein [Deltaproteobacteria bacterium]